jgi:hypothetical protein
MEKEMNTDKSSSLARKIKELREARYKSNVNYTDQLFLEVPKLLDALEIMDSELSKISTACPIIEKEYEEDMEQDLQTEVYLKSTRRRKYLAKEAQAKVNDLFK